MSELSRKEKQRLVDTYCKPVGDGNDGIPSRQRVIDWHNIVALESRIAELEEEKAQAEGMALHGILSRIGQVIWPGLKGAPSLSSVIEEIKATKEDAIIQRYKYEACMSLIEARDSEIVGLKEAAFGAKILVEEQAAEISRNAPVPVAERLPTEEDAAPYGYIELWVGDQWSRYGWWELEWRSQPDQYTHWRRIDNTPPKTMRP